MPRLFTGLEIPEFIIDRLSLFTNGLQGARWVEPDNYHITLRFAGDIGEKEATEFASALDAVRVKPFKMRLTGLNSFGNRKPRSIWVGVEAGEELIRLQHANERAARDAGLPPETRKFIPHLTLARLKNLKPPALARFLERIGGFESEPFNVERFVLFSSRPGSGGGPYVAEKIYQLNGK